MKRTLINYIRILPILQFDFHPTTRHLMEQLHPIKFIKPKLNKNRNRTSHT